MSPSQGEVYSSFMPAFSSISRASGVSDVGTVDAAAARVCQRGGVG